MRRFNWKRVGTRGKRAAWGRRLRLSLVEREVRHSDRLGEGRIGPDAKQFSSPQVQQSILVAASSAARRERHGRVLHSYINDWAKGADSPLTADCHSVCCEQLNP